MISEKMTCKVKQMPGLAYGRDYFLGDKVTAKYYSQVFTPKVAAVVLEHEKKGAELVDVICRV
jgi:hypothetical protein